jgi:hypothetical protein
LKKEEEIIFVHDMLENVLRHHAAHLEPDDILNVTIMRDTLCWILEHDSNKFNEVLILLREMFFGELN